MEEQLKQRVIGKRYCISRKRKSYKRSTSRSRLAVCPSVKCLVRNEKLSSLFPFIYKWKARGLEVLGRGKESGLALTMCSKGNLANHIRRPIQQYNI